MTIRLILTLIFWSTLLSCNQQQWSSKTSAILGDWTYIEENTELDSANITPFKRNIVDGYLFLPNSICQNKLGYFKQVTTKIPGLEKAMGNRAEETKRYFLGTETKFKIEGDSLKIFNLIDSTWERMKVLNISPDTLVLQYRDNTVAKYAKKNYQSDNNLFFDEIIVSSSGCLGFCPINNIIINQSGQAIYFGEKYNTKDGLYAFPLTKDEYTQIVSNFKKADIKKLNDSYEAAWTDDVQTTLTFLKDGKIIKNIRDYGNAAPVELYWAYMPVKNMYQLKQLDTLSSTPTPIDQISNLMSSFQFTFGLSKSEVFYFWNLLRQAKETQEIFRRKYELDFHGTNKIAKVETDGRFYNFKMLDGSQKALDIGFNFLEKNSLTNNLKNNENVKVYN